MFTYSYVCHAKVVVSAGVESARIVGIWKCLSAKIGVLLCFYLQIVANAFCDKPFLERPSL